MRLTKMVQDTVKQRYKEQKAKGEKEKEAILLGYLKELERKVSLDGKKGRKIEFLEMVMSLYQDSFIKNRELLKEYHEKASERLSV